jgi:hypothetical protein
MPEPLDVYERQAAYRAQVALGAVKTCAQCGEQKPVSQFAGYGAQPCRMCTVASRPIAAPVRPAAVDQYTACACGAWKLAYLPRCGACQRVLRARVRPAVKATARMAVGA